MHASLRALQAFEAAARLGSFAAAAEELSVTPAAISQQVRGLEDQLGRKLFSRMGRSIVLTEAGREVLPRLTAAFGELGSVSAQLSGTPRRARVTVSVPPSMATGWLPDRLPDFIDRHGAIEFSLRGEDDPVDFEAARIDLRLSYGAYRYPEQEGTDIVRDSVYPVCSPEFARLSGLPSSPTALAGAALIHTDWGPAAASFPAWDDVFRSLDVGAPKRLSGGTVANSSHLAVLLAARGFGVALGQGLFIEPFLRDGRLIRPVAASLPLGQPYCLTMSRNGARNPSVLAFRDWLAGACRESVALQGTSPGDLGLFV